MAAGAVDRLISEARRSGSGFRFEGEALADLRAVLRANARQPNRLHRVSATQFLTHLRKQYNILISRDTLTKAMQRQLGRTWDK